MVARRRGDDEPTTQAGSVRILRLVIGRRIVAFERANERLGNKNLPPRRGACSYSARNLRNGRIPA